VSLEDVSKLEEAAELSRSRKPMVTETWKNLRTLSVDDIHDSMKLAKEEVEIVSKLASGEQKCIECGNVALSYCTMFEDFFCLPCFAKLHQKGARRNATAYKLDVCCLCAAKAAKLECMYTHKLFCEPKVNRKSLRLLRNPGENGILVETYVVTASDVWNHIYYYIHHTVY
jgi:hypothetical protein